MRYNKLKSLLNMIVWVVLAAACSKEATDPAPSVDPSSSPNPSAGGSGSTATTDADVPQINVINLGGLGMESGAELRLVSEEDGEDDESECDQSNTLGVFGMALGGACHSASLAGQLLLGEDPDTDGDGEVTCDDLTDDSGVLVQLMCQEMLDGIPNVVSIMDDEGDDGAFAISFEEIEGMVPADAAGTWTRGAAANFPAHLSLMTGESPAGLIPMLAIGLESLNEGRVYVDMESEEVNIHGRVDFANSEDTTDCQSDLSKCHRQEIRIYAGEGEVQGPPNGFHITIYADDKEAPTFIALEGKYRYTEEGADSQFGGSQITSLPDVRQLYFQAVQKGEQIWGKFFFRDEAGELLEHYMAQISGDLFEQMSEGVCQDLGSSDWTECSDVDGSDYVDSFVGEDDYDLITESPGTTDGIVYPDVPTEEGICDNTGSCLEL